MIRPWCFMGMMMQVPLVAFTKKLYRRYPGSSIGNVIFWIFFCIVGQPMAILLYTVDYFYLKQHSKLEVFDDNSCRVMWQEKCLIR
jgi:hypothetical protein